MLNAQCSILNTQYSILNTQYYKYTTVKIMDNINRMASSLNINTYKNELTLANVNPQEHFSLANSTQSAVFNKSEVSGIQVSISAEGKDKLEQAVNNKAAKENAELGKDSAEKLHQNKTNDVDKSDETAKTPIEEIIAKVKEQIEEVKRQLDKLSDDDSEAALEQRKLLNSQLMDLNGQLLALIEKQLQQTKSA
jgi:hypothetical protein